MPDFSYEIRIHGLIAGVDEVGRGPLAGPVIAAAAILPRDLSKPIRALIDDSKKLSATQRQAALIALRNQGAIIAFGAASTRDIFTLNILHASLLAMRRAIDALPIKPDHLLIDGNRAPKTDIPCTTIISGDAISLSIAAASIAAKLLRDDLMRRLHTRYPNYGWANNAGYAAPIHRNGIITHGPTPHHRLGFGPLLQIKG